MPVLLQLRNLDLFLPLSRAVVIAKLQINKVGDWVIGLENFGSSDKRQRRDAIALIKL